MDNILEIYNRAPKPDELSKALTEEKERVKWEEARSAIIDPMNYNGMGGVRSKPTSVPFAMLRRMSQVPAIAAIILTRQNQCARFTRRPRFDGDLGFTLRLKDKKAKMTDAAHKRAQEIEEFMMKTGGVKNLKRKDNFNTFLRKIVRDTLTLDAMAWENVPNMKGGLAEIWAVDAATIELVVNAPTGDLMEAPVYVPVTKRGMKLDGDTAYIQRVNGLVTAEYSEELLAYAIRNPRTDIDFTDYGMSELETLIEIITGIMNGVRYNTSYFNSSHLPQGVLSLVGNYNDKTLEAFKRQWKNLTAGASGKWATPVIGATEGSGVNFIPFKNSNRDMEFNEFLEFMFNIACAVYQIDPNEVGFKSWTSNSGSMGQSDNTEAKMEKSEDKGLIPLMNFISDTLNSEVIDRIDEEFELGWVGLDEDNEDAKIERMKTYLDSGYKTVNMLRKENDEEPIKAKWADAPANATLIQVYMAETGMGQQQEGADPNDPQAEADVNEQQAQNDHGRALEASDDQHEKQLEIMDKQHEQNLEAKKLDQQHQAKIEDKKAGNASKMEDKKAANAKQMAKDKPKPGEGKEKAPAEDPDDKHDKELEKMDKQHKQTLEQKKVDHKNNVELEKVKAKAKPKPIKKSFSEDGETVTVEIDWANY